MNKLEKMTKRPGGMYVQLCVCVRGEERRESTLMCSFAEILLPALNGPIHNMWAFSREMRRNHGLIFS